MKYCLIAFLFFFALKASAKTQDTLATNIVYIEIAGNGGAVSGNYEWRFDRKFSLRLGLGYFTDAEYLHIGENVYYQTVAKYVTVPLLINYFLNFGGRNNIQIGAGVSLFTGSSNTFALGGKAIGNSGIFPTASIGYRRQPKSEGFMIEITATPFYLGSGIFVCSAGLGFGYVF